MVENYTYANITLWGGKVGTVAWDHDREVGFFEYEPDFLDTGLNISPLTMDITASDAGAIHSFPTLNKDTFYGLPGLLADSLPDKFGNAIIDAWLARQGRNAKSFNPVERLCYTGKRGMGALEFAPEITEGLNSAIPVEIDEISRLAQNIMAHRIGLDVTLADNKPESEEALRDIIRIGTSAGGARPKAIIAMNSEGHVLSGQAKAPKSYDYWILKLDGVTDLELGKPQNYGRIEYAYYLMAKAAGINMTESRLHIENDRAHFLTKRFDRIKGDKIHMLTLCGMAHFDFNMPGIYAYEQAFNVMRDLGLEYDEAIEQYRRMIFNVIARNQDDHTKNITFLMDKNGKWSLSPAYDVTYSHNPSGRWTNEHQMTINGKRDHFTVADLETVGEKSLGHQHPSLVIEQVYDAVIRWKEFAEEADLPESIVKEIKNNHRLEVRPSAHRRSNK